MSNVKNAKQFWITAPSRGEILKSELAPRQVGEVLIRTLYSGISRGTEALVFRGEVPLSQYEIMRAPFQEGNFPGPVKYGYASVGKIEEDSSSDNLVGRSVFCLFPHQDRYYVHKNAIFPVPEGVPPERAVLAANLETAINIVWDSNLSVGDKIVIIGAGVIGLLVAWLCNQIPGTSVMLVDPNSERVNIAQALDVTFCTAVRKGTKADVVVHTSGQPDGLRTALTVATGDGIVVDASWYGTRSVTLPLGEDFHSQRITLKSSQVGRIPPSRIPRWNHNRRLTLALKLLSDPVLDLLISDESRFEELPDVMARLSQAGHTGLCCRIVYPET